MDAPSPTPTERDPFVDLVRVAALAAVVLLHWLSMVPRMRGGVLSDVNVVDIRPGLWPLTWVGQVMPLFFFAGGYANRLSLERGRARGERLRAYLARRTGRLVEPTLAFLGLWVALDLLLRLLGLAELSPLQHVATGSTTPFGPLWFVGVYLVVVLLSPLTVALDARWGAAVPVAMAGCVAAADLVAARTGHAPALTANIVLVWLVPHQLGHLYAGGRLRDAPPRRHLLLALTGLVGLVVLTGPGGEPRSQVAFDWLAVTPNAPKLSVVAEGLLMVGTALLLRPAALRLLARPAARERLDRANALGMPVYLWHMTAFLAAVVLLDKAGDDAVLSGVPGTAWWLGRPLVVLLCAALLLPVTALVSRATAAAPRLVPLTGALASHGGRQRQDHGR